MTTPRTEEDFVAQIADLEQRIKTFRALRYDASADALEFRRQRAAMWLDRLQAERLDREAMAARSFA